MQGESVEVGNLYRAGPQRLGCCVRCSMKEKTMKTYTVDLIGHEAMKEVTLRHIPAHDTHEASIKALELMKDPDDWTVFTVDKEDDPEDFDPMELAEGGTD